MVKSINRQQLTLNIVYLSSISLQAYFKYAVHLDIIEYFIDIPLYISISLRRAEYPVYVIGAGLW